MHRGHYESPNTGAFLERATRDPTGVEVVPWVGRLQDTVTRHWAEPHGEQTSTGPLLLGEDHKARVFLEAPAQAAGTRLQRVWKQTTGRMTDNVPREDGEIPPIPSRHQRERLGCCPTRLDLVPQPRLSGQR